MNRKRKVKPLRASQGLSKTFPCTGYEACSLKGTTGRESRCGHWNLSAVSAPPKYENWPYTGMLRPGGAKRSLGSLLLIL